MVRISAEKKLIIVADDLGYHPLIDEGIVHGIKRGLITSASIIVLGPTINKTSRLLNNFHKLDLGLHLILSDNILNESQKKLSTEFLTNHFFDQYTHFTRIFRKRPSNFSLHHSSNLPPFITSKKFLFSINLALSILERKTSVFLRNRLVDHTIMFNAQNTFNKNKEKIFYYFSNLKPGLTLFICHPAMYQFPDNKYTAFASKYSLAKRRQELKLLTDKKVIGILKRENIKLTNFKIK